MWPGTCSGVFCPVITLQFPERRFPFSPDSASRLLPFPASGNRNNSNGAMNTVGSNGNYWSSSPNSVTNGFNLNFNSGSVNPSNNNNRANGFPVRCVRAFTTETESLFFMTISYEQLRHQVFQAYCEARTNKRGTSSQLAFELNLEDNLMTLTDALYTRTYKPSRCICFMTHDPVLREVFRLLVSRSDCPSPSVQLSQSHRRAAFHP